MARVFEQMEFWVVLLSGVAAVGWGLYLAWPPLAWTVGGAALIASAVALRLRV